MLRVHSIKPSNEIVHFSVAQRKNTKNHVACHITPTSDTLMVVLRDQFSSFFLFFYVGHNSCRRVEDRSNVCPKTFSFYVVCRTIKVRVLPARFSNRRRSTILPMIALHAKLYSVTSMFSRNVIYSRIVQLQFYICCESDRYNDVTRCSVHTLLFLDNVFIMLSRIKAQENERTFFACFLLNT